MPPLESSPSAGTERRGLRSVDAGVIGVILAMPRRARDRWLAWHRRPCAPRILLKLTLAAVGLLFILYPKPWLIPRWFARAANLNSVLQPELPALGPLAREVRSATGNAAPLWEVVAEAERVVYDRLPYAFDWETWGVVDYLPDVEEALRMSREDCDGRAVVAASLLRRLGYEAWLVCDIEHMWVVARDPCLPESDVELMDPGRGAKTVSAAPDGRTRVQWNWAALANVARGTSYGVAVFPFGRELAWLAIVFALTLHPRLSSVRAVVGGALLLAGLLVLRAAGGARAPVAFGTAALGLGLGCMAAGWLSLAIKAAGGRCPVARSE